MTGLRYNSEVPCKDQVRLSMGLVTNYGEEGGGSKTGGGGHVKFYPYENGGAEKVLAMLKGGHKKFWGRFYAVA